MLRSWGRALGVLVCFSFGFCHQHSLATPAATASTAKLPITFEINQGQVDAKVKFFARGGGYSLFLTGDGSVLSVTRTDGDKPADREVTFHEALTIDALGMKLIGANPGTTLTGVDPVEAKSNYLLGNDRSKWVRGVTHYQRVKYSGVYPGVDLVFYGNDSQLEHDFVVAPGADPAAIRFRLEGAKKVRLDDSGALVATMEDGQEFRVLKPTVYQQPAGGRHEIGGGFVLQAANEISFRLGKYDRSRELVIDPTFTFATFFGDGGPKSIVVDPQGNPVIAGFVYLPDFPTTVGAYQTHCAGVINSHGQCNFDLFVAKMNATGSALLWSTYLGGSAGENSPRLVLDNASNVYIAAYSESSDYPTTANTYSSTCPAAMCNGSYLLVLSELSADGSSLLASTYVPVRVQIDPLGIGRDADGNILVGINAPYGGFPTANDIGGARVLKMNAALSSLVWTTVIPPPPSYFAASTGTAFAVDPAGNSYIAGTATTPTQTASSAAACSNQALDVFVAKISPSGAILWNSAFACTKNYATEIYPTALGTDANGNVYLTGIVNDDTFPTTPNALYPVVSKCGSNVYGYVPLVAFASKLSADGTQLLYSTYVNSCSMYPLGIAADQYGAAYLGGRNADLTSIPLVNSLPKGTVDMGSGNDHTFLAKLNSTGSAFLMFSVTGSVGPDTFGGVFLDSNQNLYADAGAGVGFPVTPGAYNTTVGGGVIMKVGLSSLALSSGPGALTFPVTHVGTVSSSQAVKVYNDGPNTAHVAAGNIKSGSGEFLETDNCAQIAPGSSCTVNVSFAPTTAGPKNATLTITPDINGPFTTTLQVSSPAVTVSPTSLNFSQQSVGTTSTPQGITLTSDGNQSLSLQKFQITGDFSYTTTCLATQAPSTSCAVNISFAPTAPGARNGTFTITDNTGDSPQTVALAGNGSGPQLNVPSTPLDFKTQQLFQASGALSVNLSNSGNAAANISSIAASGDFQVSQQNCGSSLAAPGTCAIQVTFTPSSLGQRSGTLTITDSAQGSPHTVQLKGSGVSTTTPSRPARASRPAGTSSTTTVPAVTTIPGKPSRLRRTTVRRKLSTGSRATDTTVLTNQ